MSFAPGAGSPGVTVEGLRRDHRTEELPGEQPPSESLRAMLKGAPGLLLRRVSAGLNAASGGWLGKSNKEQLQQRLDESIAAWRGGNASHGQLQCLAKELGAVPGSNSYTDLREAIEVAVATLPAGESLDNLEADPGFPRPSRMPVRISARPMLRALRRTATMSDGEIARHAELQRSALRDAAAQGELGELGGLLFGAASNLMCEWPDELLAQMALVPDKNAKERYLPPRLFNLLKEAGEATKVARAAGGAGVDGLAGADGGGSAGDFDAETFGMLVLFLRAFEPQFHIAATFSAYGGLAYIWPPGRAFVAAAGGAAGAAGAAGTSGAAGAADAVAGVAGGASSAAAGAAGAAAGAAVGAASAAGAAGSSQDAMEVDAMEVDAAGAGECVLIAPELNAHYDVPKRHDLHENIEKLDLFQTGVFLLAFMRAAGAGLDAADIWNHTDLIAVPCPVKIKGTTVKTPYEGRSLPTTYAPDGDNDGTRTNNLVPVHEALGGVACADLIYLWRHGVDVKAHLAYGASSTRWSRELLEVSRQDFEDTLAVLAHLATLAPSVLQQRLLQQQAAPAERPPQSALELLRRCCEGGEAAALPRVRSWLRARPMPCEQWLSCAHMSAPWVRGIGPAVRELFAGHPGLREQLLRLADGHDKAAKAARKLARSLAAQHAGLAGARQAEARAADLEVSMLYEMLFELPENE